MIQSLRAPFLLLLAPLAAPAADRPNVLFIYTDDHSHRAVGCYPEAYPFVRTPNLDRLAKEGVRFAAAYNGSWCAPSRATMLTGLHPYGVESMRFSDPYPHSTYDPKQCRFWPAEFRRHGYVTAQIGKWHTGTDAGFGRDWDHQVVWNRPAHTKNAGAYYQPQILSIDGGEPKLVPGYSTDNYTKWAVEFIQGKHRDPKKPWFLWLCYGATHGPITPAGRHKGHYADAKVPVPKDVFPPRPGKPRYVQDMQMWAMGKDGEAVSRGAAGGEVGDPGRLMLAGMVRKYAECGQAIDDGVGKLLEVLEATGQTKDTLVVFTSDQGFALGEHGFRHKLAPYDANLRSPLIVRRPGAVPAGKVCDVAVSGVDLPPTFFAAAGLDLPWPMHGHDLTPLLKDPSAAWPHVTLYTNTGNKFGSDTHAIPKSFPKKEQNGVPWWLAVRQGKHKYIRTLVEGEVEELYDLEADPDELTNLAYDPKARKDLDRMRAAMAAELKRTHCGFAEKLPATRTSAAQPAKKRPNILYVMTDDHAAHAISAYGSKVNTTPQLDRLAKGGMRFANCFVTNSICTPSRAAILTGKYSHINGVPVFNRFDGSQPTLAKYLQAAGYHTGMIGKWHLGSDPTGFDVWRILPGQGLYHAPVFLEAGKREKYKGYCTELITDFTIDFLDKRPKDRPFFVMCHHKAPHRPWQPAEKYKKKWATVAVPEPETFHDDYATRSDAAREATMRIDKNLTPTDLKETPPEGLTGQALKKWQYQRYMRDYLACVDSVDEGVGRLLDYLDKHGLADDTVVVYTSDQGFFLGDHNWYDKRFMYEESLRMPFLVRWPGVVKPGSVSDGMILNVDFAPTLLSAAGLDVPADMQGRSFVPLLKGEKPADWRTSMYYRYYHYPQHHRVQPHYGVRTATHKLIYFNKLDQWELFDLEKDPRELKNVYADPAYAETVKTLKAELYRLKKEVKDDDRFADKTPADNVDAPRKKDKKGPAKKKD